MENLRRSMIVLWMEVTAINSLGANMEFIFKEVK